MRGKIVTVALFGATLAGATPPPCDGPCTYIELGASKSELGDHSGALSEFAAAYMIAPRVETLFNVARESQLIGNAEDATAYYCAVLETGTDARLVGESRKALASLGGDCKAVSGNEAQPLFHRPSIIVTRAEFHRDTVLIAKKVVLTSGARIRVAQGASWRIFAEVLEVAGPVHIDGTGEPGVPGLPGATPPEWATSDRGAWESSCVGELDRGGQGGPGGNGGPGARVEIRYVRKTGEGANDIETSVAGGPPGLGGPGGAGRTCRGPDAQDVKFGPKGNPGVAGKQGPAGTVVVAPFPSE